MASVARLRNHAEAFDKMLVLIPAKFYYPPDSADGGSNLKAVTQKKRKQEQMSTQQVINRLAEMLREREVDMQRARG